MGRRPRRRCRGSAAQVGGGYGSIPGSNRGAQLMQRYESTSQIQQLAIARERLSRRRIDQHAAAA